MTLFRAQALNARQAAGFGRPLMMPARWQWSLGFAVLLVCGAGVWMLATGSYARSETVFGWLEPTAGTMELVSPADATVTRVFVAQGATVEIGDPLIALATGPYLLTGPALGSAAATAEAQQQAALRAEVQELARRAPIERQQLRTALSRTQQSQLALQLQRELLAQRIAVARQQHGRIQVLVDRGHAAPQKQAAARATVLALRERNLELSRLHNQGEMERERLAAEIAQHPARVTEARSRIESQLASLSRQRLSREAAHGQLLRASRSGIVAKLQARRGQLVERGAPLLTLGAPQAKLQLALMVPVKAIGFLQPGQRLALAYDAFPQQKYGTFCGQVTRIAPYPLTHRELARLPARLDEPHYRLTGTLCSQSVTAFGKAMALKAGMTLRAQVKLGERSFLEWLFEPLLSLKGRL
jgi:membrane fusion protein